MQTKTNNRVYAGFAVRLAAFLVDMLIVNAGLLVLRIPKWILTFSDPDVFLVRDLIFQYSLWDIAIYLVTVAYFVLMTYYCGATLGKKLFHLRVVSMEDRKLTMFEVIYRESIGRFLSSVIMSVGYLIILVERNNRALHDLLSDTCVVYYHEKKVYTHSETVYRNMNRQYPATGNTVKTAEEVPFQTVSSTETSAPVFTPAPDHIAENQAENQIENAAECAADQAVRNMTDQGIENTAGTSNGNQAAKQTENQTEIKMDSSYFSENE